jgi:hypothetical protein
VDTGLIGYYSNMKVDGPDDPHFLSGYNIALYDREGETRANISVAIGSSETARATVSSLRYDPATKGLNFTARYSARLGSSPIKGAPDCEAFEMLFFRGVVRPESIFGKMGVKDFYCRASRFSNG